MTIYEEVGERIRELRTENGYTGEKLGQELGTSKAHVSHLESGKVKQDLEVLLKISKLFNANLLWLAKGEGRKYITQDEIERSTLKNSERDRYEQRIDQLLFAVKALSEKLGKRKGVSQSAYGNKLTKLLSQWDKNPVLVRNLRHNRMHPC